MTPETEGLPVPNRQALEQQIDQVQLDVRDMRSDVKVIAEAITRLAVMEERSQTLAASLERVASQVEKIDERQRNSEITRDVMVQVSTRLAAVEEKVDTTYVSQVKFEAKVQGMSNTLKVMWAAFGTGVLYIGGNVIQLVVQRMG